MAERSKEAGLKTRRPNHLLVCHATLPSRSRNRLRRQMNSARRIKPVRLASPDCKNISLSFF
jgi:hypothetical protein